MSITDELREYIGRHEAPCLGVAMAAYLRGIADRIDAEHQKAIRELNNLADANVLLPVDADGVPIHLGDEVYQVEGGWVYTVKSITFYPDNTTISFECKHGFGCDNAHNVRHYHEPTVEDVLHQFLGECENAINLGYDEVPHEVFAEYAAKLRLADDGKEQ